MTAEHDMDVEQADERFREWMRGSLGSVQAGGGPLVTAGRDRRPPRAATERAPMTGRTRPVGRPNQTPRWRSLGRSWAVSLGNRCEVTRDAARSNVQLRGVIGKFAQVARHPEKLPRLLAVPGDLTFLGSEYVNDHRGDRLFPRSAVQQDAIT